MSCLVQHGMADRICETRLWCPLVLWIRWRPSGLQINHIISCALMSCGITYAEWSLLRKCG